METERGRPLKGYKLHDRPILSSRQLGKWTLVFIQRLLKIHCREVSTSRATTSSNQIKIRFICIESPTTDDNPPSFNPFQPLD